MSNALAPDIVVPSNKQPTFWNRTAAAGAAIGTLISGPIGLIVGGTIGGFMGKAEMERERTQGKVVSPPSFWNKDTAIGAAIGNVVGAMIGVAAALMLPITAPVIVVAGIGGLSAAVLGMYIGGKNGEKRLAEEYTQAKEYALSVSPAVARGRGNPYTVSPEEAQLLESRLMESQEKSMVAKLAGKDPRFAERQPTAG